MNKTTLTPEEIMEKVFLSTEKLLKEIKKEAEKHPEWKGSTVFARVSLLKETFNNEKKEFLEMSSYLDDVPLINLSFKNTEADLVSWQSQTCSSTNFFANSWWSSSIIERLDEINISLIDDKQEFIKKWNSK